eukprot:scaffold8.g1629.t1
MLCCTMSPGSRDCSRAALCTEMPGANATVSNYTLALTFDSACASAIGAAFFEVPANCSGARLAAAATAGTSLAAACPGTTVHLLGAAAAPSPLPALTAVPAQETRAEQRVQAVSETLSHRPLPPFFPLDTCHDDMSGEEEGGGSTFAALIGPGNAQACGFPVSSVIDTVPDNDIWHRSSCVHSGYTVTRACRDGGDWRIRILFHSSNCGDMCIKTRGSSSDGPSVWGRSATC